MMKTGKHRSHRSLCLMLILGVLVGPLVLSSETQAEDSLVKWERIEGVTVPGNSRTNNNVVAGVNSVGFSWSTSMGKATLNLLDGQVKFWVKGLVLASQNLPIGGLVIGTPGVVTAVKGTVVCNADTPAPFDGVVLVDTDSVPLSRQGDARFEGTVNLLPFVCDDMAFLIRVVNPGFIFDQWIAYGVVRTP